MPRILRTDSSHPDFIALVKGLDLELAERDGNEHAFYAQYNKIDKIRHAIVLYEDDLALACGAIKELSQESMEVKRMYTLPLARNQGYAGKVLQALEDWARELNYTSCLLETGKRQPEAISLYMKNGYQLIPNYGQYEGVENSVCFEKKL